MKRRWSSEADDFVYFVFELVARFACSKRDRHNDTFRTLQLQSSDGGTHRGTRCQAIVDQDNVPASKLRARADRPEGSLAPRKLSGFFGRCCVYNGSRDAETFNHVRLQYPHIPARDGARCQFFLPWNTQLSHEENVQTQVQSSCNLERNRHSAARQSEYQYVRMVSITGEAGSQ